MFKDHFSAQALLCSQARPTYPESLFKALAGLTTDHHLAWDCATGNGQAAICLANYFSDVIATDASFPQVANALQKANVHYCVALAEAPCLREASVSLITVAQALHWFDFDRFYAVVKKVLKPRGIFAAWNYPLLKTSDQAVNQLIKQFYHEVLAGYWPPERKYVDDHYRSLPFPFEEISLPEFAIELSWSPEQLLAYLNTWSAVNNYVKQRNEQPVTTWFMPRLAELSNPHQSLAVTMPLILKVGRSE